jgi:hypothetical protein
MSVVLPQVLVHQDFNTVPSEITDPLRPFICGPEYDLHRYNVSSEKEKVGTYSQLAGNVFNWVTDLGRTAGSNVDLTYTKVYLDNALLQYYKNAVGGTENTVCAVPSGYANRVKLTGVNLKTANGTTRSTLLYGRDVKVGDYAKVETTASGSGVTAKVIGFVAEPTASTIDTTPDADSSNGTAGSGTNGAAGTYIGNITSTVSGTYEGMTVGVTHETYTIVFTQGSVGNSPQTVLYDVISASGKDTRRNVAYTGVATTIASGTPGNDAAFEINTPGLGNLTFKLAYTNAATDVQRGWSFTVAVQGAYTLVTPTAAGTYTGEEDTKYIVKVVRGGTISTNDDTCPVIQISTNNSYDTGGQIKIKAVGANSIGSYGVTFTIPGGTTKLIYGDKWYVAATAPGEGAVQTLVLDKTLNATLIAAGDLNVTLYIYKNVELKPELFGNATVTNWTQDATEVELLSNAQVYDAEWRSGQYGLPVISADIYIHWRALLAAHTDKIYSIDQIGDISTVFSTPSDPENPLVYAVEKALLNSNSTSVRFMALETDDKAGYTKIIDKLEVRDDLYTLVPLTQDKEILDLFVGHVNSMSTPESGLWRVVFFSRKLENPLSRVGVDEVATGAIAFNATTQLYELSLLTPSTGVDFLEADEFSSTLVKSGDVVHYNFDVDNNGAETYDVATVDEVLTSTKIQLLDGTQALADTQIKIYRNLDTQDQSIKIGLNSGVFKNRRVYNVYPDVIQSGGIDVSGMYLAAAIAGLVGGVVPHQGLTNVTITGFDNANNVVHKFNRSQLDSMANAGTWIVTHDLQTGEVYTRHELSTNLTDVNTQELMVTKNVDSISYLFKNNLKRFIGRANVTPRLLATISTEIAATVAFLKNNGFTNDLGSQLVDATIESISQHPLLKDRVVVVLNLTIPYPLNNLELHLVV